MFLKKAEVNVVPRYRTLSEVDDSRDSKDSRRSKIFRLLMILEYAADDLETTLRLIFHDEEDPVMLTTTSKLLSEGHH